MCLNLICIKGLGAPMSDIVFFDTHDILTIFQFDAIYRDILTIFSKCKLGLNAPKFHSRSAYVDIFATKLPIYTRFVKENTILKDLSPQNTMPCEKKGPYFRDQIPIGTF